MEFGGNGAPVPGAAFGEQQVPSLQELRAASDAVRYLGPAQSKRQVREWALVLSSQAIESALCFSLDGWLLRVSPADEVRAKRAIALYTDENRDWPPRVEADVPRHRPSWLVALAFAALALFYLVTGPAAAQSLWFSRGQADARLLLSQPWRMVTALTLHANSTHVAGNVLSGGIFGSLCARRLGAGGALLAILAGGALGNALNALAHLPQGHLSIGASTAVFAAVGILAGFETARILSRRRKEPARKKRLIDLLAPLAGGLALLGELGSGGEGTDLGAHGFGFGAGVLIGLGVAAIGRQDVRPSRALQLALASATILLLSGSWALALLR